MVRRTKEEALETRNRILDAAEDVFYARGVARTSLSDIAQAAGVTRGAIYWHFRNKTDVFAAMCERVKLPMETMCTPLGVEADDPLGELRTVGNFLLRQLVEDAHWRKVFEIMFNKCEFVEDTSPILKRQQESFEEGMAHLTSIIEQATRRGQLPADLDIPLAVAHFHATFNGIMGDYLFYPDASSLATKRERLLDACASTRSNTRRRCGWSPHRPLPCAPGPRHERARVRSDGLCRRRQPVLVAGRLVGCRAA